MSDTYYTLSVVGTCMVTMVCHVSNFTLLCGEIEYISSMLYIQARDSQAFL